MEILIWVGGARVGEVIRANIFNRDAISVPDRAVC